MPNGIYVNYVMLIPNSYLVFVFFFFIIIMGFIFTLLSFALERLTFWLISFPVDWFCVYFSLFFVVVALCWFTFGHTYLTWNIETHVSKCQYLSLANFRWCKIDCLTSFGDPVWYHKSGCVCFTHVASHVLNSTDFAYFNINLLLI